jgi:gluconolactonase
MKVPIVLLVALAWSCAAPAQQNSSGNLVAKNARPVLLSSEFKFTEGPAADAGGNVFFTDQPNDRIMKWSPDAGITEYMKGAGRSNGLYFDRRGNLISCADEKNELWSIDKNKNVTVLITDYKGRKLNGPNDLWVDAKGGVYITDPYYQRDYWSRTQKEIAQENVYYLTPDRKELRMVMDGFIRPNGIIGTADGRFLYIADIGAGKTYRFNIQSDGSLFEKKLFVEMGSDGLTIDEKGNIYLTGKGVTVFNPAGQQVEHIDIPEDWTANLCFGGKDRRTLFITASKSVYTLQMSVRGVK